MKPLPRWARELQRTVETATLCKTCGKKTLVSALAGYDRTGRRNVERVTRETHCACAGGPAAGIA